MTIAALCYPSFFGGAACALGLATFIFLGFIWRWRDRIYTSGFKHGFREGEKAERMAGQLEKRWVSPQFRANLSARFPQPPTPPPPIRRR